MSQLPRALLILLLVPWAIAEERIEGQFLPEDFFYSIEKQIEKNPQKGMVELKLKERTVSLIFEPWEIAQPRFRKVFKAPRIPQTLFFKTMGYDRTSGVLEVPCVIFRASEAKGGQQRSMGMMLKLKLAEKDAWEAIRRFRRRELRVELTATIGGVRWEFRAGHEVFLLKFGRPSAKLKLLNKPWLSAPVTLTYESGISPNAQQERAEVAREFEENESKVALRFRASEFDSLKWYADWETGHRGWYAREFLDPRGDNYPIAVLHKGKEGAVMSTRLAEELPPGEYQIFIRPLKIRQRVRENILVVSLNGKAHEFRWHAVSPLDSKGWIPAPIFATDRKGGTLTVKGIQVGGGGVGGVPEPPGWTILLDEFYITDNLDIRSPSEILDIEE